MNYNLGEYSSLRNTVTITIFWGLYVYSKLSGGREEGLPGFDVISGNGPFKIHGYIKSTAELKILEKQKYDQDASDATYATDGADCSVSRG